MDCLCVSGTEDYLGELFLQTSALDCCGVCWQWFGIDPCSQGDDSLDWSLSTPEEPGLMKSNGSWVVSEEGSILKEEEGGGDRESGMKGRVSERGQ